MRRSPVGRLARALGVTYKTVWRWSAKRGFPALRDGDWDVDEVRRWRANYVPPPPVVPECPLHGPVVGCPCTLPDGAGRWAAGLWVCDNGHSEVAGPVMAGSCWRCGEPLRRIRVGVFERSR